MKYHIGLADSNGYVVDFYTKENFLEYLNKLIDEAEQHGDENFAISTEYYDEEDEI